MKPIVKCKQCRTRNEVERMFCIRCGARLDHSRVLMTPSTPGEHSPGLSGFLDAIRSLLALGVFIALVLVLWPVAPGGARGSRVDSQMGARKVQGLRNAVEFGQPVTVTLQEAELNAYLADLLSSDAEAAQSKGRRMAVGEINLVFTPDYFVALVLANWGPVRLSYELRRSVRVDGRSFGVEVLALRWGHLPLPGPAAHWMAGRMAGLLGRMERERRMLDGIRAVRLGQGAVSLATGGGG